MASLTDDLRYLSRAGYRDPWAEATNNITNSLFQLANTKYQRDTLLAQIQNREEDRAYRESRDLKLDTLQAEREAYQRARDKITDDNQAKRDFQNVYKDEDPVTQMEMLKTEKAKEYYKNNPEILTTLIKSKEEEVENRKTITNTLSMSNDDEETYQSMLRISSNPYLTTGERTFVNSRIKNIKTILDDKAEAQQNMQYFDSVVSQGYIKQNSPMYQVISDAIKFKKYQQANQLMTKAISKSGDAAKLFRDRFEELTDNYGRAVANDSEEVVSASMAQLNSFIETTLPTLPPKYENYYRKRVQDKGFTTASQIFSTFEGILNLWNNGLEPTDENFGRAITPVNTNESGNQISYKNISDIPENEFVLPDTSMAQVNVGDTTQTVTGVAANNLVRSGRGSIIEDTAYAEIEIEQPGNFGRVGEAVSEISDAVSGLIEPRNVTLSFKTGKRIPTLTSDITGNLAFESKPLENGDEVIDKQTKERFPLIIKEQAGTSMFPSEFVVEGDKILYGDDTFQVGRTKKDLATKGKYIVNGTTYTYPELKEKFGVPLYQKQVRSRSTAEPMPVNANNVMQDTTLNIEDLQVRVVNPETGDTTEIKY